jgi:hypothetical protein
MAEERIRGPGANSLDEGLRVGVLRTHDRVTAKVRRNVGGAL